VTNFVVFSTRDQTAASVEGDLARAGIWGSTLLFAAILGVNRLFRSPMQEEGRLRRASLLRPRGPQRDVMRR